jgi:iron complex outermembrane recepter protein
MFYLSQSKMKKILYLILSIISINLSFAQKSIKGKIYDANTKEPVVGATVKVENTPLGAITDISGTFEIKANATKLVVTNIGYETKTIDVIEGKNLSISLETASEDLQTVVVTGNREASLRTETPIAISKITPKMIDEAKVSSIYEVINKTPGVLMVNLNNEQHSMSIRQPMTTNAYYLYMEDGVPIRPMGVFNHNSLLEMNQFTVSSVEVVKGPVSSIYGPEAVGGAINFISQRSTAVPTARIGVQADQWGFRRVQYGAGATIGKFGIYLGGLVSRTKRRLDDEFGLY